MSKLKKFALLEISDSNTATINGGTDCGGTTTYQVLNCMGMTFERTDWDDEGCC